MADSRTEEETFFWKEADLFLLWLGSRFSERTSPFDRRAIEAELESLKQFGAGPALKEKDRQQLALL
jgi:hypothetical protein